MNNFDINYEELYQDTTMGILNLEKNRHAIDDGQTKDEQERVQDARENVARR